jgi:hypothetical protein
MPVVPSSSRTLRTSHDDILTNVEEVANEFGSEADDSGSSSFKSRVPASRVPASRVPARIPA